MFFCMYGIISVNFLSGQNCGITHRDPSKASFRIVEGTAAEKGAFPYLVSLQHRFRGHQCGGSIFTDRFIITAAHCFMYDDHPESWTVFAGDHHLEQENADRQRMRVEAIKMHDGFTGRPASKDDIALVKLAEPLQFNDLVGPVCLPSRGQSFADIDDCFAAGWGDNRDTEHFELTPQLQQVREKLVDHAHCHSKHRQYNIMTNIDAAKQICFGNGEKTACKGDSGGPLACKLYDRYYLAGVTSFGHPRCRNAFGLPSVFTNVGHFTGWIGRSIYSLKNEKKS